MPAPSATAPVIPALIVLTGSVSGAAGEPLPEARVQIWPDQVDQPLVHLAGTDAQGRFRIELPAGSYRLYAEAPGHEGQWWGQAIHLGAGESAPTVDIRLAAIASPAPPPSPSSPPPDPTLDPTTVPSPLPGATETPVGAAAPAAPMPSWPAAIRR